MDTGCDTHRAPGIVLIPTGEASFFPLAYSVPFRSVRLERCFITPSDLEEMLVEEEEEEVLMMS